MNAGIVACIVLVGATITVAQPPPVPTEPQMRPPPLPVLMRTEVRDENGQFALSYSTHDGTMVNEQGILKQVPNTSEAVLVKEGYYSYTSPEGIQFKVSYVADEFGFRPQGAHLPQPVQPIEPVF